MISTKGETLDSDKWHLDKRVPISIIIALFVQFMGGVWFISKLEARILALEMQYLSQKERDDRQDRLHNDSITVIRYDLQELNRKLDRLIESNSNLHQNGSGK